jgi:hypothetical protein
MPPGDASYTGRCDVDEEDTIINNTTSTRLEALRGSGLHPIDRAIRELFLRSDSVFKQFPPLLLPPPSLQEMSIEDEIAMERRVDEEAIRRRDEQLLLTLRWEQLRDELEMMQTLRSALVRPETASGLTGKEILRAEGGLMGWEEEKAVRGMLLGRLKEEAEAVARGRQATATTSTTTTTTTTTITTGQREKLSHRLLRVMNDDNDGTYMAAAGSPSRCVSDGKPSYGDDEDDESQMADSITTVTITRGSHPSSSPSTHSVPLALLQAMHSTGHHQNTTSRHSHHHHRHHSSATGSPPLSSGIVSFDPYPDDADCDDDESDGPMRYCKPSGGNVMSRSLFDLLMRRLRLTRPARLPIPINNSPVTFFRFDRLLYEQVAVMKDGSIVLVQIMYGVLLGASLSAVQPKPNRAVSSSSQLPGQGADSPSPGQGADSPSPGTPPAAVRFLATHLLPHLQPGLTLLLYDVSSKVSRASVIQAQSLRRVFEAFHVRAEDFPSLARCIGVHAHQCLQLTRVGGLCTAVLFSIAAIGHDDDGYADGQEENDMMELITSQLQSYDRAAMDHHHHSTTELLLRPAPETIAPSLSTAQQQWNLSRRATGQAATSPRRAFHASPIRHRLAALRHYLGDDELMVDDVTDDG